jgi:hypothetical protein
MRDATRTSCYLHYHPHPDAPDFPGCRFDRGPIQDGFCEPCLKQLESAMKRLTVENIGRCLLEIGERIGIDRRKE